MFSAQENIQIEALKSKIRLLQNENKDLKSSIQEKEDVVGSLTFNSFNTYKAILSARNRIGSKKGPLIERKLLNRVNLNKNDFIQVNHNFKNNLILSRKLPVT